ncbi:MAG: RNA polymerase-binding protein DksA [Alphaproteobacteria bacterium]|uniref:RNA polymerase-binding protein DksA n=1 Tax=Candidatus Nitrobium versatile TaxID=2884831 RepID=A0A953SFX4_9BACT|nr:RNA polymerase-binding protein DksA [Candidatus Nitrobium versatile]
MKAKDKAKPERALSDREKRLQEIRKKLTEQRESLLSGAGIALNALPEETIFPELGDQASAEIDRNFMLRLKGRERKLLKKIDEAIEKIDNGTYGICESCNEEINIKRLEARPVTALCIECKTEQEEEEKLRER